MSSVALGLGLVSQSVFVGGNVAIVSIMIPLLRQNFVSDSTRVKQFSLLYDRGAVLMASSALVSTASYAWLYFYGPQLYAGDFLISALASFSPLPVTWLVVYPSVARMKLMLANESAQVNSDEQILKWTWASSFRAVLFSVGCVSSLHYVLSSVFPG